MVIKEAGDLMKKQYEGFKLFDTYIDPSIRCNREEFGIGVIANYWTEDDYTFEVFIGWFVLSVELHRRDY